MNINRGRNFLQGSRRRVSRSHQNTRTHHQSGPELRQETCIIGHRLSKKIIWKESIIKKYMEIECSSSEAPVTLLPLS